VKVRDLCSPPVVTAEPGASQREAALAMSNQHVGALSLVEKKDGGARLKALEALAPYKQDIDVRHALMTTLRNDSNPGMRVNAIELLTAHPDRELVEVLQDVVRYEPNNYVRLLSEQTLAELNASIGLY